MAVSNSSPNVDNYGVLKGIVKIMRDGEVTLRDIGNAPEFEVTGNFDVLDHFSSRSTAGVRVKDRSVMREKSATVRIVMDEITADNFALWAMGNAVAGSPVASPYSINLFEEDEIRAYVRFIGTNSIGAKIQMDLPIVSFRPSGPFNAVTDEWGQIEITGEVLADSNGDFGTADWNIDSEILRGSPPV